MEKPTNTPATEEVAEGVSVGIVKTDGMRQRAAKPILNIIQRKTGLKIVNCRVIQATREQILAHYNKDEKWLIAVGERIIKLQNKEAEVKRGDQSFKTVAMQHGQKVLDDLVRYMTDGRIAVFAFQGPNAVPALKEITGATEPASAAEGTIRKTFGDDSYAKAAIENRVLYNTFHCSENDQEAEREYNIWFDERSCEVKLPFKK
jgi:nucleoside-diphosphate kinase